MKRFLFGCVLGAACTALVFTALTPGAEPPPDEQPPQTAEAVEEEVAEAPAETREPAAPERVRRRRSPPGAGFDQGTFALRVGEGYVFGADHAQANPEPDAVDLICLDVQRAVSLSTPAGGFEPGRPVALNAEQLTPAQAFDLLTDAPEEMTAERVSISAAGTRSHCGVGLVRGRDGRVFKVVLERVEQSASVLDRVVHIRYAAVRSRDGGGIVPTHSGTALTGALAMKQMPLLKGYPALPGASFTGFIEGQYRGFEGSPPEKLELSEEAYLHLEVPLNTEITFKRRGALYAAGGIGPTGRVVLDSYSGTVVNGDMEGTIDVESYAFVRIKGNVTGKVNIDSYATVIIEGDILPSAHVKVRSYTTLYLNGLVHDPAKGLDQKGSCWSTFHFDRFVGRQELERFTSGKSVTLHVRDSDVPVGEHEGVGPWRKVIVGADHWKKLERAR